MARDLRELFETEQPLAQSTMPEGHEKRFMEKLDESLPLRPGRSSFSFIRIAAGIVLMLGLGYLAYDFMGPGSKGPEPQLTKASSLEEISPELKKVEDYYLANINLELSKLKFSPENKELFDGYVRRLDELSREYERLSKELLESGPNEKTISALIDNLKFRLNLLYRLKEKLDELNNDISIDDHQV